MSHRERFFKALENVFVGAKVEGDSGYINLMKIKSRYYREIVFPRLRRDIIEATRPFPDFQEELFLKLYTFFNRYFSASGSIYFTYTPLHQSVYEQVYTDDRDVILFYKTHMLYYVKTDRLFRDLEIELDGNDGLSYRFRFDVSNLEHKKANEKRSLVYELQGIEDEAGIEIALAVTYSERGRKTRVDDILRAFKKKRLWVDEDLLNRAFRLFERQSEVDYFINKDARAFLEEQFDLWLYQYVFCGESEWTETRIRQLQALKKIATSIIAFIAQFEDELLRVWNKPKFVRRAHYVITLERIARQPDGGELLARLLAHDGLEAQTAEWAELGLVDDEFDPARLLLADGQPAEAYQFLPLDTKHFPDLELPLVSLFDNLDEELDGWLVHSENYQALNTIQNKFRGHARCVHIDPPYNTDTSGFLYVNQFRHATWLTMMDNRIRLAMGWLDKQQGSLLVHIDENEMEYLNLLLEQMGFAYRGNIVWDKRNPMLGKKGIATQHEYISWCSFTDTPVYRRNRTILLILETAQRIIEKHGGVTEEAQRKFAQWIASQPNLSGGERAYRFLDKGGRIYQSVSLEAPEPRTDPKFFKPIIHPASGKPCPVPRNGWSRTPETMEKLLEKDGILFGSDETTLPRRKVFLTDGSRRQISSILTDSKRGKHDADALGIEFPYSHPVSLYTELMGAAAQGESDIILDFFAGSATTAHAVINLNREDGGQRKYILVEMADYFDTVLLPRIKKVVFCEKWKDGKPAGGQGLSHFIKYYQLEQYEDTLRKARYRDDADLFHNIYQDPYHHYVFMRDPKMLDALEVDAEANSVSVHLERLYPDIDVAETLSNLSGKWIKRIQPDPDDPTQAAQVEFADGEIIDLKNLDYRLVKPLIWW